MQAGSTRRECVVRICHASWETILHGEPQIAIMLPPTPGPWRAASDAEVTMATNNGWRKVRGRWTRSLGMRGLRVRLFENRSGMFYRDVWVPGEGYDRKC